MAESRKQRRARHPDSPWLWRPDWASKRMRSSQGAVAAVACVFALVFSGFSIPLVMNARELMMQKEGLGVAALAAIFPIAALGLCYWALTETARWARFRNAQLQLETLPGVVGGRFAATAHVGRVVVAENGFRARLTCLKKSRKGNKTRESAIWQHEIDVPNAQTRRGPFGTAVPIAFDVPFESEPASADPQKLPSITWRLEVFAELSGADFSSAFDVPIFKTDESSPEVSERFAPGAASPLDSTRPRDVGQAAVEALDDARIAVARRPDGSLEIELPASRNRAGALFLTCFAIAWNAFVFYGATSLPGLFKLALAPFLLVGGLLALFVPVVWLQSTTLVARPGALTIRQRMFGEGSAREIPVDEIKAILPEAQGGNAGRTKWSVRIQVKSRRKGRAAAQNLASKADAQRIAAWLTETIARGA